LVILNTEREGERISVHGDAAGVGRSGENRIALDDRMVSRKHARFVLEDGVWQVEDLDSRHGILVNCARIEKTKRLEPGDLVKIGGVLLRIEYGPAYGEEEEQEATPGPAAAKSASSSDATPASVAVPELADRPNASLKEVGSDWARAVGEARSGPKDAPADGEQKRGAPAGSSDVRVRLRRMFAHRRRWRRVESLARCTVFAVAALLFGRTISKGCRTNAPWYVQEVEPGLVRLFSAFLPRPRGPKPRPRIVVRRTVRRGAGAESGPNAGAAPSVAPQAGPPPGLAAGAGSGGVAPAPTPGAQPGPAAAAAEGAAGGPALAMTGLPQAAQPAGVPFLPNPYVPPDSPAPAAGPEGADAPALPQFAAVKPVAVESRPRPADLEFAPVKAELQSYLDRQPVAARRTERDRIIHVSKVKEHLVHLMRYLHYEDEKDQLRLRDGRTLRATVFSCNRKEIRVRRLGAGGGTEALAWSDLAFEQYAAFLDFFIRKRLDYEGTLAWHVGLKPGTLIEVPARKDAAVDCFLLALLCDWYGRTDDAARYAKTTKALDPTLNVERFVPIGGEGGGAPLPAPVAE